MKGEVTDQLPGVSSFGAEFFHFRQLGSEDLDIEVHGIRVLVQDPRRPAFDNDVDQLIGHLLDAQETGVESFFYFLIRHGE